MPELRAVLANASIAGLVLALLAADASSAQVREEHLTVTATWRHTLRVEAKGLRSAPFEAIYSIDGATPVHIERRKTPFTLELEARTFCGRFRSLDSGRRLIIELRKPREDGRRPVSRAVSERLEMAWASPGDGPRHIRPIDTWSTELPCLAREEDAVKASVIPAGPCRCRGREPVSLEFRAASHEPRQGYVAVPRRGGRPAFVAPEPAVSLADASRAVAVEGYDGSLVPQLSLDEEGAGRMESLTEAQLGKPIAAVYQGRVVFLADVQAVMRECLIPTGLFDDEQVCDIVCTVREAHRGLRGESGAAD